MKNRGESVEATACRFEYDGGEEIAHKKHAREGRREALRFE
jgi:hypothetical protein